MSWNVVTADAVATAERAAMNEVARIVDYVVSNRGGSGELRKAEIRLRATAGQLQAREENIITWRRMQIIKYQVLPLIYSIVP